MAGDMRIQGSSSQLDRINAGPIGPVGDRSYGVPAAPATGGFGRSLGDVRNGGQPAKAEQCAINGAGRMMRTRQAEGKGLPDDVARRYEEAFVRAGKECGFSAAGTQTFISWGMEALRKAGKIA